MNADSRSACGPLSAFIRVHPWFQASSSSLRALAVTQFVGGKLKRKDAKGAKTEFLLCDLCAFALKFFFP
jgi:hypothetical protein